MIHPPRGGTKHKTTHTTTPVHARRTLTARPCMHHTHVPYTGPNTYCPVQSLVLRTEMFGSVRALSSSNSTRHPGGAQRRSTSAAAASWPGRGGSPRVGGDEQQR